MTPGRRATVGAAAGAAVAWTAIMLLRLFAGGAVGMGDQGDSRRLLCQLGVRSTAPFNADRAAYLYPTWVAHHWYGEACSGDGSGGVFRSSELWLLSMAKHLTPILGLPGALDLRALGIICSVLVGVCVGLWVLALPGGIVTRVGVASLVGLLVADGAFADTLISPYSEPAELIGILALCPVLLLLWRRGHTTWPTLAAVAGVATVVISAKTQAAALAPAIVLAVLWLPAGRTGTGPEPAAGRARKALLARLPALFVTLAVGGAAAYFVATASPGLTEQNVYASVFGEILVHSPDPAGDLRSLGADPHLVTAIGSNPESSNAATLNLEYLKFRQDVTETRVIRFYLTHPARLLSTARDGLKGLDQWEQDYVGSYQVGSGHAAGAIEDRVGVYGALFRGVWEPLLVGLWLATLGIGWQTARRIELDQPTRALGRLAVVLGVAAFFEFWAVMISMGFPDVYRHMVLTNMLVALGIPILVAIGIQRGRRFISRFPTDLAEMHWETDSVARVPRHRGEVFP